MRLNALVVCQVLMVFIGRINTAKAAQESNPKEYVGCDKSGSTLKCGEENNTIICISNIDIGSKKAFICPDVPPAQPNSNCNQEYVQKYILHECNGQKRECMPFYNSTDISEYCERAFKYVTFQYTCVSLRSECASLYTPKDKITTTQASNSLPYVMAQKVQLPTKIFPTKTTNISDTKESYKFVNSTLPLDEAPAITVPQPESEATKTFISSVPGSSRLASKSPKELKRCTRNTSSMKLKTSTISQKSPTEPTQIGRGRNAGLNFCFHFKFYVMIVLNFVALSLL